VGVIVPLYAQLERVEVDGMEASVAGAADVVADGVANIDRRGG
jgi:hypothetical protein